MPSVWKDSEKYFWRVLEHLGFPFSMWNFCIFLQNGILLEFRRGRKWFPISLGKICISLLQRNTSVRDLVFYSAGGQLSDGRKGSVVWEWRNSWCDIIWQLVSNWPSCLRGSSVSSKWKSPQPLIWAWQAKATQIPHDAGDVPYAAVYWQDPCRKLGLLGGIGMWSEVLWWVLNKLAALPKKSDGGGGSGCPVEGWSFFGGCNPRAPACSGCRAGSTVRKGGEWEEGSDSCSQHSWATA